MRRFQIIFLSLITFAFALQSSAESSLPPERVQIIIDKAEKGTSPTAQTLSVYIDKNLVHRYRVSTGLESPTVTTSGQVSDRVTPTGRFKIYARDIDYVSNTWVDAEMPFALFFSDGAAIHATSPVHYGQIGQRDSGGCVRLHSNNAKIVWDIVEQYGVANTVVIVFDGHQAPYPQI